MRDWGGRYEECFAKSRIARFWRRVEKKGPNDCWLWRGTRQKTRAKGGKHWLGYGYVQVQGHDMAAHRYCFILMHGPIPDGFIVRHSCDVPLCMNPAHHLLGTQIDNVNDRVQRKRAKAAAGEKNGRAKLNITEIQALRHRYFITRETKAQLARDFNTSQSNVRWIVQGHTWKGME